MNRAQRRALAKQPMFQVVVKCRDERGREQELNVGPRSNNQGMPAALCEGINKAVSAGKEKRWFDARVVRVDSLQER